QIVGYRPTCGCDAGSSIGSIVFDPFAGSGTTLQVARALGRRWLGAEMNADYAKLAEVRIATPPRWAQDRPPRPKPKFDPNQMRLFA
ncbi:MAG: DNA methyltransferase, partial [Pirellulales bacterium]